MPPDAALRPATFEDVITSIAKQHQVPPELALSIAEHESNFDPSAKSSAGAIGIMQLMPATAQSLGVDPDDPVQNITGGIKLLAELRKQYGGDVQKMLQAYNAGPSAVDSGVIPAETQAYTANVMAGISKRMRKAPDVSLPADINRPVASHGAAKPEEKGFLASMADSMNPMNREGRRNLAGMAGGVAGGLLASPSGPGAIAAAPVGAAAGGALEDYVESLISGDENPGMSALKTGATQGAYEAVGGALMWPVRRLARAAAATTVGRQAVEEIGRRAASASEAASTLIRHVKGSNETALEATRQAASKATTRAEQLGAELVEGSKVGTAGKVTKAAEKATAQTAAARKQASELLARADAEAADDVASARALYEQAHAEPPAAPGGAVKPVVAGLPGHLGDGQGPAKRALDIAGKRVEESAQSGPAVDYQPVQQALEEMRAKAFPEALNPAKQEGGRGIGFLANRGPQTAAAAAQAQFRNDPQMLAIISKQLGEDLKLPADHPLPGVLAKIQNAPASVSFADSHALKTELDSAVNWDRSSKNKLQQLTKGIRNVLREQMSGHAPYDEATSAYRAVVPLYRSGVGQKLIRDAAVAPDRVATVLSAKSPAAAQAVKDLLVTQSAKGGSPEVGQQAWDAVRSAHTYNSLIKGGVEKLSERVEKLTTENPEFAKVVYGDATGSKVLNNLKAIGDAYKLAEQQAAERIAAAKAAGQSVIAKADEATAASLAGAKSQAKADTIIAKRMAARGVNAAREQGAESVLAQRRANAQALMSAHGQAKELKAAPKTLAEAFKKSSLARFTGDNALIQEGGDIARASALGLGSFWGATSMLRLLAKNARADELIQWAALSDRNTQRMVRVLTSHVPDRFLANTLRDALAVVNQREAEDLAGAKK